MDRHVDLIRNDWDSNEQVLLARIVVGAPEDRGYIVKAEANGRDWEHMVDEAIGLEGRALPTVEVIQRLTDYFRGVYLIISEPHGWDECPFHKGSLPFDRSRVPDDGEYELPAPPPTFKTSA